jgi:hypothetical protein
MTYSSMTFITSLMITGQVLPGGTHNMMTTHTHIFFFRKEKYFAKKKKTPWF